MSIKVITTLPGEPEFQLFLDMRLQLYEQDFHIYLGNDRIDQENLIICYLILQSDQVVARASLYFNSQMSYQNKKTAFLGHYECVNDDAIATRLIDVVRNHSAMLGAKLLVGPMNGSTWNNYRFLTNHDRPNFLLEPFNHLYYNEQFVNNGFDTIAEYESSINTIFDKDDKHILDLERKFLSSGVKFRNLDLNSFEQELTKLYPLITTSFQSNFLYTPIDCDKFKKNYLEARAIINSDYFILAEDMHDNPIGFIFSYENLLDYKNRTLIVKTLARDPANEWSGLGFVLSNQLVRIAIQNKIESMIYAFMKVDAPSIKVSQTFNGKSFRKYALYGLDLSQSRSKI